MAKYIGKRILAAIPLLLLITIICFALMNLAPYDAIDTMFKPGMSEEVVANLRAKYGYDQPAYIQYFRWIKGFLTGSLGYSIVTKQSIAVDLASRLPNTIRLVLPSYLTAYVLAIVLGLIAGANRGKRVDRIIDGLSSVLISVPSFWIGMMLIYFFGYRLKLLPILGMHKVGMESSITDFLVHFVMPYTVLVIAFLPDLCRYVRSSTITQYSSDYVMVQKAYGASRAEIMFKHVLKNVLLPVITKLGMALPQLITGAIITETIFSWPGVGPYFTKAVGGMDYPVVMAILVLSSAAVIIGNMISDILYCITDPRIKDLGN